ncbi:MAG: hypothetical protein JW839_09185 [Candidatus Lokiarchaeota archaeon]|nr:hypothetical protein [Candidatus Lokiarchaeota archaeon]
MADEPTTLETVSEQDLAGEKLPRMFPLRLGFFSFMFLAFFAISVLVLNVSKAFGLLEGEDVYQLVLDVLRTPIQDIAILRDIYDFIVTFPGDEFDGIEALYISGGYVLTFFTVSLVATKKRAARILFSGRKIKRITLQILLFFGLFILYMQLLKVVVLVLIGYGLDFGEGGVAIYMLIAGATTWVFFQALALFTAARRSGTRVEGRVTRRGGRSSHAFALFAPYLVLVVIGVLYFGYKLFLDIVVPYIPGAMVTPAWRDLINYFTMAMAFFCVLPSLVAFASKKRRQKSFDNLVVIMTILSMYPYILFNFTIYFLLPQLSVGGGGGGGTDWVSQAFLWGDLIFTLVLLVMAMRSVGKRTNYKFGALDKHAFIMFIYAALAGQFGIRYLQTRGLPEAFKDISLVLLSGQYVLVNFFVVVALFFSVLLFSSKKFGLYFRVHETVSKADNMRLDFIKDYLRDEYVRREEPYLLDTVYESMATVMKLDRFEVMRLVEKAKRKHPELRIDGLKKRYVYFEAAD